MVNLDSFFVLIVAFLGLMGASTWALSRWRKPDDDAAGARSPGGLGPRPREADRDGPREGVLQLDGEGPARIAAFAVDAHQGELDGIVTQRVVTLPEARCFFIAGGLTGNALPGVAAGVVADALRDGIEAAARRAGGRLAPGDLREALVAANAKLRALDADPGEADPPGVTVVAVLAAGDRLHVAHVGADRAFRLRGDALEALTEEHSLLGDFLRQHADFTPEKVRHVKETFPPRYRQVVVRALGMKDDVEPTLSEHAWAPGDVVALTTKGLGDVLDEATLAALLGAARAPEDIAPGLVSEAARLKPDEDHAAIVLRLDAGSPRSG